MNNSDGRFQILIIDFESNNSSYQGPISEIAQSVFYTENYLKYFDLCKQKKIDAILVNIKLLIEQQPREFNNIKKQLNEFRIPIFFFTLKSGQEINIESALNTSIAPPDSILIQALVLNLRNQYQLEKAEKEKQVVTDSNKDLAHSVFDSNEVNRQKAIFIRNLTFEIRTLLNNVGGPIQLIKEKIDDPELIPFFGIIDTTLNRLVEFTFKANLSSDLKMGNYPIKKTMVNFDEIIRFTALELTEFLELEKIKLTVNAPESKINFYGDKDLLFHCFTAILDKTISLTKEDGEIQIDFSTGLENIDCKITISSSTFPKQDILNVFNSTSIEQEIGLAFAKIVLDIHNGEYWVDLTKETGVTIGISFKTSKHE